MGSWPSGLGEWTPKCVKPFITFEDGPVTEISLACAKTVFEACCCSPSAALWQIYVLHENEEFPSISTLEIKGKDLHGFGFCLSIFICLSTYLLFCLYDYFTLTTYPAIFLSFYPSTYPSTYLFICLSFYLSI